jgi:hypothetical protein
VLTQLTVIGSSVTLQNTDVMTSMGLYALLAQKGCSAILKKKKKKKKASDTL